MVFLCRRIDNGFLRSYYKMVLNVICGVAMLAMAFTVPMSVDSAASVGVLGIVNLFTALACWITGRDEVMYYFYKRKQRKGK